jgi:riboflavin kinase / FMN adenylyltransferase
MPRPFDLVSDPRQLPARLRGAAVAIGNFDGVHRGHQALLAAALAWGEAHGRPALMMTFEPHPRSFFRPDQPLFALTPPALKTQRATAAGIDGMVVCPFDASLAVMSAEDFCASLLKDAVGAAHVVTGGDFRFGHGKGGDVAALARMGERLGFTSEVAAPVMDGGAPISSSRIRALLASGEILGANAMLGWEWSVSAVVQHGDKRGRVLGYPTANLHLDPMVTLAHGIYAVRATANGVTRAAVASHGRRPTFDGGLPKLEVHLFDFTGDLYGKIMDVAFVGYIRPELKFDGIEALIARMDADSAEARAMLARD